MSIITKLTVDVTAKGMEKLKGDSQQFHDNMVKGAAATKKAVLSASAPSKPVAAARQESQDYGVSRSLRPGGTGASARDFAQEAQGLGGLVRLYATYAANIFAVGAAFRALSNAMDTTNMVKGLDQLGAASGMALGSLSKRLVDVTDGAISLREAMESVAKASSSGMSSDNILRMGKVAKQASQALGVDMADAVNRITRGITKLEPELLDEIGIFTRVDSASRAYAKSIDKSVDSLTDFEKRMAFANAVLEEGERKFSAIQIDTNPYTKLAAAIKDAAQTGLEFANKVLAPIVGLLAESPKALMAVLAGIGMVLIKQALPAIGEFKAGLASAADKANEVLLRKAADASEARKKIERSVLTEYEATSEDKIAAVDAAEKRIAKIEQKSFRERSAAKKLLEADLNGVATLKEADDLEKKALKNINAKKESTRAYAAAELEVSRAVRENILAKEAENKKLDELRSKREKDANGMTVYGMTVRAARQAEVEATKSAILSNAAYTGSTLGVMDAWRNMKKEMKESTLQLNAFQAAMFKTRGAVAIVGGALSTIGNALSGMLMWVGLIITAVGILDSIFSGASKQVAEFESAVQNLDKSTDMLGKTFASLLNSNPFSINSLQAQASAMLEVSNGLDSLTASANKALIALSSSTWSRFKDNIKSLWGGDVQSTFEESLANTVVTAIEELDNAPIQGKLKEKLSQILNVKDVSNFKLVEKALENLDPKSDIVREISKAMKAAAIEAGNAASKASEFDAALKESEEAYKAFTKQFQVTDPLSTFASKSIAALYKLQLLLDGPIEQSLSGLLKLSDEIGNNPLFGPDQVLQVNSYAEELRVINSVLTEQKRIRKELAEEQQKETPSAALNFSTKYITSDRTTTQQERMKDESYNITEAQRLINRSVAASNRISSEASARAAQIAADFAKMIPAGLQTSVGYIEKGIASALAKGSTLFLQNVYSKISDVPEVALRESELKKREIAIEEESIRASMSLSAQLRLNAAATEANTAAQAVSRAQEQNDKYGTEKTGQDLDKAEKDFEKAKEKLELVRKIAANPLAGIRELNTALGQSGDKFGKYAQDMANFAQEVAGFKAQLNKLGQDRKAATLDGELKLISSIATKEKQTLDILGKTYEQEQKSLNAKKESIGYTTEAIAIEQEALTKKQIDLTYSKELVSIREAYNQKMTFASAVAAAGDEAGAKALRTSAEQNKVAGETNAELVKRNALMDAERQKIKDILLIAVQRLEIEKQTELLKQEQGQKALDFELELQELKLDNASIGLPEEEVRKQKMLFDLKKASKEEDKKLYEAKKKYDQDIAAAQKAYTEENAYESEKLIKQIMDGYEAEKSQIKAITEEKLSGIKKVYEASKNEKIEAALTDSIVTALTKGGKEGAKVLRNFIVEELRRKITLQVSAQVKTSDIGKVGTAATNFASTVMAGYETYNLGGGLVEGLNTFSETLIDSGFEELGFEISSYSTELAGYTDVLNGVGVGISALTSALDGDYGAAIGEALGYAIGGPIGAAVGKFVGSALGLTDDSGTFHTGGAGSYSSTQGQRTGSSVESSLNFNLEGYTTEAAEQSAAGIAEGLVKMFDSVAEAFGLEAGYYAATAFADDTSKDGAWGALMVKLGDKVLVDWESGTDKWPGREFADGEAGQKEYLNALAKDTVTVLKEMDLPAWADSILSSLGESPTFEKLQVAMAQINALNQMFDVFSTSLGWAREEIEGLIGPLGGIQAGTQLLSSYYQNFYSESERLAISTETVKDKLADLGQEMPSTREGFRALVDSARAAGDETLVANLLKLAPAFAEVTEETSAAVDKIKELAGTVSLTAESLSQIMVDGFMNGVDGAEIGKMIANTIQRGMYQAMISGVTNSIAEMIYSQILSPMLASIVSSGTIVGAVSQSTIDAVVSKATQMIQALAEVLNSPEFQAVIASIGSLANINFGGISVPAAYQYSQPGPSAADQAEDARNEALKAVDNAFNALKKAIDAEKKLIQEQIKLAEENLDKINALIDVLDTSIKELRSSVDSTAALQAEQGQQFIMQALTEAVSTGALPDSEEMAEAIAAVRSGIDKGNYDSKFAEDRAKLILAGQLDQLKALGLDQKTDAELQLEALNAQITALDTILETAQAQVDAIKGVDTSVKTVTQALAALQAALAAVPTGGSQGGGSSSGWGGVQVGGSNGSTTGNSGILKGTTSSTPGGTAAFYKAGETFSSNVSTSLNSMNLPVYTAVIDGKTYSASGGGWFNASEYLQKNTDVAGYIKDKGYGSSGAKTDAEFAQWHFQTYGIAEGRKYADGGIFSNSIVNAPTIFDASLMGEAGPEAIMPLGKLPDGSLGVRGSSNNNAELVAEIRNLKAELTHMKQYVAKTSTSTEESRKLLDEVVRGGSAITVESEIASY